jgi:hypothetical protein
MGCASLHPSYSCLPSGYPGSFILAAIPWLWFKAMDPKLMQWAGGDIAKANVDPLKRQALYHRYGATPPRVGRAKQRVAR